MFLMLPPVSKTNSGSCSRLLIQLDARRSRRGLYPPTATDRGALGTDGDGTVTSTRLNPSTAQGKGGDGGDTPRPGVQERGGMALSSRAHAFSVEALVGRSTKRKGTDGAEEESGLACRQNRRVPELGWYRWGPSPPPPQSYPPNPNPPP